nr:glycoside hydrolase family 9 protein [Streptomyces sp. NBC_00899]
MDTLATPPTGRPRGRRRLTTALTAVCTLGLVSAALAQAGPATAATTALVRVDQAGYLAGETKHGYVMSGAAFSGATFSVVNSAGTTVLTGSVGSTNLGSWNTGYPDVYPISFDSLTTPGTYHIVLGGSAAGSSPSFRITDSAGLYGKLVADGVTFFQTQRDGSDVVAGTLNRKAAHLNDATANVYAWPSFATGSDTITNSNLSKTGGPVDLSGGWYDAGDYLKFTHTQAFGDAMLFASERALGSAAPASLDAEAHYGEAWLNKAWNQSTKTLALQVGIGSGNSAGTFTGDHDLWRLPEKDDADTSSADRYAAAHRPVFNAASAGGAISPNLAGRTAAAFALAAQVDATANPAQAAAEYQAATSLYAQAKTSSPPSPLTTALPNDYYPESTWHDDMEFGGAEIALAAQKLGHDASPYLTQAATHANSYLTSDTGDTFNLYDTSALAHADLIRAITAAGNPSGLATTPAALTADLKRQVQAAASKAAADIFHAGGDYTDFDVNAHTFGFLTTEALYKQASGDATFDAFATGQRDWLLGANAWGTSFMIGEGSTFPHCPQHQVANLSGSLDGTGAVAVGAVVNGPNNTSQFSGGLGSYSTGMKACPSGGSDAFSAFSGHSSRYVDDVRSWQSSEPALDMTGAAIMGAAAQESLNATAPSSDFSVSLSPVSGSVKAGSAVSAAVSTAVTSGSAESVALSASGLPSGASASFSPSAVTSGGSSTLTITTGAATPAGTYAVTVTGTAATGSHTATYTLTVTAPSGGTCNPAWSATASYIPNDKVSYSGHNYTALYWSTGVTPGSAIAWNIWQDNGTC